MCDVEHGCAESGEHSIVDNFTAWVILRARANVNSWSMEDVANCTPPFPSPVQVLLPGHHQYEIGAFCCNMLRRAQAANSSQKRDRLQLARKMSCRTVHPKRIGTREQFFPCQLRRGVPPSQRQLQKWHRDANMGFHMLCFRDSKAFLRRECGRGDGSVHRALGNDEPS